MKKIDAEALCARLDVARIDRYMRVSWDDDGVGLYSVRAFLAPLNSWSTGDVDAVAYAKNVIDIMCEGDWSICGEDGQAYVSRY